MRRNLSKHVSKVVAVGALCLMFASTAFAANEKFKFLFIPKGGSDYTETNAKSDNEGYAYITVTDSNLGSGDTVSYVVTNKAKSKEVTSGLTFVGAYEPYKQTLKYKSGYAKKGAAYRLKITTHNYNLEIHGRWNS